MAILHVFTNQIHFICSNFKDFFYNQAEGTIRFQVGHDRSVTIHIPTGQLQTYMIKNICGPPTQRLKLEWM